MQPATGPFRAERITSLNSALSGGYVIKQGSGIIVAAVPGSHGGELAKCEGTARLLTAGANHLPDLIDKLQKAEKFLESVRKLQEFADTLYSALTLAEGVIAPLAQGGSEEAKSALKAVEKAAASPVWDRLGEAVDVTAPLLDALDHARRDCP